jgi:hypothetical protein
MDDAATPLSTLFFPAQMLFCRPYVSFCGFEISPALCHVLQQGSMVPRVFPTLVISAHLQDDRTQPPVASHGQPLPCELLQS